VSITDDLTRAGFVFLALLGQKKVWIDKQGVKHKVKDIDAGYAANIIRFLERRANSIKFATDLAIIEEVSGPMGPGGDAANDALDAEIDRLWAEDPKEWLHRQPLLVALNKRAAA